MRKQDMTRAQAEEALGLPDRYDKAQLRARFMELARRYHPDSSAANGIPEAEAQRRMVEVNRAYGLLKPLFDHSDAPVQRDLVGDDATVGSGVHVSYTGRHARRTQVDDSLFWDEEGRARDTVAAEEANGAADAEGHGLRRVLLGPVVPRVVMVALLALVWWRTFPLGEGGVSLPQEGSGLAGWAAWSARVVYPTYLLAMEALTGHLSGTLRDLVNGAVSLATGAHVEVRRKGAYRSSLSSLIEDEWFAPLLVPLALWLLAQAQLFPVGVSRYVWLALGAVVGLDALLALLGTGLAVSLSHRLADAVERRYVVARMDMLKRCGQWAADR